MTQAPKEGKPSMVKPVFMKFSPWGWAEVMVWREWRKQKSSAWDPRWGRRSEIILPDLPRGLKSQKGLAMLPVGPSKVTAGMPGGFWPWYL